MNLNASNELPPSSSTMRPQGPHSGRRLLSPANAIGSHHVLPSYPSSTLQYYYPLSQYPVTCSHISSPFQPIHGQPTVVEHPVQTLLLLHFSYLELSLLSMHELFLLSLIWLSFIA